MVNSCGGSEGVNEFILFTTTASATAGSYTLYYGSNNPPSAGATGTLAGTNAAPKAGSGTITSSTGCTIVEVTTGSTVIPANSNVIFIPSDFDANYDVSGFCASGSTLYVVYITRGSGWSAGGTLANNPSGSRYIQIVNGSNTCTSNVRSFSAGWSSNTDGNAVSWSSSGTATYINNGCNIVPPPQSVSITPTAPSVCKGATTATLNFTTSGSPDKYTLDWNLAAQAVGFTDVYVANLPASPLIITVPATAPAGTYTAALTVSNSSTGVASTTQNITLTILDKPVVAEIMGINTICEAYTYFSLMNATPGGVWSSTNTAILTVTNTGAMSGVTPGNATINYTVTNTCGSTTKTLPVTVTPKPVVAEITGVANLCIGGTATFTDATPGGTWSSTGSAASVNSSGVVTGLNAGTDVISYTVTNSCGSTTKTFPVTIGNSPVVASITGTPTACVGTTTTLSDATAGGSWSSNNTAVATVNSAGVVTGVAAGTATISYTVTSSCGSTSQTLNVTIGDKPVVAAIAGTNNACVGATTTLTDATAGGTWDILPVTIATINSTGTVTGVSAGNATATYTVTNSCGSTTKSYAIIINDKPTVADITGPSTVNMGSSITLTSTTAGGVWSSDNPAIAPVNTTGTVTGFSAGITTIHYTVSNTCGSTTKNHAVTVLAPSYDDVFIPNVFTPNGDGLNDVLKVYGTVIATVEMRVFNQWGELIFESQDVAKSWDGTYKGKKQPSGVYFYVAKVKLQNGIELLKKGSINLIR